jgi:hypothetical protein
MTIPSEGKIMYRIAIIPRMINGPTPDLFRPVKKKITSTKYIKTII